MYSLVKSLTYREPDDDCPFDNVATILAIHLKGGFCCAPCKLDRLLSLHVDLGNILGKKGECCSSKVQ